MLQYLAGNKCSYQGHAFRRHSRLWRVAAGQLGWSEQSEHYQAGIRSDVHLPVYFHELCEVWEGGERVSSSGLAGVVNSFQRDGVKCLQGVVRAWAGTLQLPENVIRSAV